MTLTALLLVTALSPLSVTVTSCYDGDTCSIVIPFGEGVAQWVKDMFGKQSLRILGYDTPEIRGKCDYERDLAVKARDLLRATVKSGKDIVLRNIDVNSDPYGRVLAEMWVDGINVKDVLITGGLARLYDGSKARTPWCPQE